MKKTIKTSIGELTLQCDGKDKDALAEGFYTLQEVVVDLFDYLMEGALRIENKKIRGEKVDKRIKSISHARVSMCREVIEINRTAVDSSFGIVYLCEDSLNSIFSDGSILVRKRLRVGDIGKAMSNIQLLINESSIKP